MLDSTVPALVLRLDDNIFHHGTLGAIRSLGRAGVEVHGLIEGRHAPASRSKYLAHMHTWPNGRDFVETLTAVAERIGRRAVLIPMDDEGAIAVAERSAELRPHFLLPDQAPELPRTLADKARLATVCAALGIAQPETRVVTTEREVAAAVADLGLPVVAKWARPWLLPRAPGLRNTSLVRRPEQAVQLLGRGGGSTLLLQRFVPGDADSDWFFHGYYDQDSACLFGGTGRKERAYPSGAGLTTYGRSLPNPAIEKTAHTIAATLGYRGILDLDFRYDAAVDAYCLLDFNPRLGAQFRLFSDERGLDLVRTMHLHLTGKWNTTARTVYGRTFLVENYDVFPALRIGRERTCTGWLRAMRGADELAWLSADDYWPFVAMTGQTIKRGFTRLARRRK
ncbi:carboxylate--amine ligase [Nonomuraea africana]|uniref:ATP-grasp superfamily ATP-dependent carboligase n=1 Tax=Nonomuraea africana TaxID=46171 RepID=A0ABR9KPD5_9ACTN|nr:ATP-grasp domain-containing protein [Nonomuraea africana]MBE1563881.1 putative ATP-grasp superfamily ATP-dependent carboligase [Nonomuraea africana]